MLVVFCDDLHTHIHVVQASEDLFHGAFTWIVMAVVFNLGVVQKIPNVVVIHSALALFEHVNLVYGTISEFCTTSGCPDMTGPGTRMYLWFDEKGKKTRVAAPQYIDYVMTFTQKTVSDESIFPTKYANEFPSSFESIARKILRLLFHVIAHLYAAHFREVALLGLHAHLNLTFAHLTALHRRFNLIEPKETEVLRDLEIALRLTDDPVPSGATSSSSTTNTTTTTSSASTNQQQPNSSSISSSSCAATATTTTTDSGSATSTTASDSCLLRTDAATERMQVENNNSSSSTFIDGDATAQPICKQPLESGSVNNSHSNATSSNKEQMMQTCGPGGTGSTGSSTGSVGMIGCGVGYSSSSGAAGSTAAQQQSSNTQTTA
ncbi:conserved hypothetical protein [Culex quinquefasciatus]|uniref:MOB kinase activator-like 2 n=1 Tax=Culex quinquefasciatus TaxID=7176 RepID=B0W747_CULQU|nr:conserved hypothetical protein [Culex quinquefasciatus]|eukprot:XP_001844531.1 conserved hypothetical protein [Culex quinquefasciatus]